jgi:glycosyltransferase involved in cell wall biosynthesis
LQGGGIFINPGDESALADAMHRLATDEHHRDSLATQALSRARDLNWDKCATAALASLRKAAA